ncbi:quinone oxidoreductase family protein [Solitalea canadensis]|uniref:Zn-dependent oxidoreductase, NADPH:quinone reductase n=1 Tax=Solitalea canadensis (strain ATCC 29591 / DSM 3403 / JCM 21819 / LMG 8368 / NBRC 15130 / NCIMB 12057 / USAM 9D) TaxID=929556 RepID=H8KY28_SOLCM|nr:quinone oxidoreductase [Solitalea canadensis]AFD05766.1 Zn-dependent oxidoreductase, NADPH:quinone reductase [Solitalea canadensis DSM 3403]
MKALCFDRFGDADVLYYGEVADPNLKQGEVMVELKAIGLNFADVYRRKGNYHLKGNPPYIAGYEGAGVVINNNGSSKFKIGDRVGFADVPFANAALVAVPETHLIPLPEKITFETAAASLLQGLTAQYLATDSHAVSQGEFVLIHAVAGGVGQLLTQICKLKGATVIGLTSSPEKAAIAHHAGVDEIFLYSENWVEKVINYTKGVHITYDSVGSTLTNSFTATRDTGHVVFYGMSGGDPAPVDPRMLMDTSKTLTGGDLWSYLTSGEERIKRSNQLFEWIIAGQIKLDEPTKFRLSEGADAHRYLESRKSTGKILLIP